MFNCALYVVGWYNDALKKVTLKEHVDLRSCSQNCFLECKGKLTKQAYNTIRSADRIKCFTDTKCEISNLVSEEKS